MNLAPPKTRPSNIWFKINPLSNFQGHENMMTLLLLENYTSTKANFTTILRSTLSFF